jgi:putative transposase
MFIKNPLEEKMARTNTNWNVVHLFTDSAEKVNCKEHFNPREFDLTLEKIATIRKTRNCKYNINYHFTWIPKTRIRILVEPFRSDVKRFLLEKCYEKRWDPLALQIMPDHNHFFLSAPPKWAPCEIIQELKSYSSRLLRRKYSIIRDMRETPDFWASGYYVGTAGHITAENVARYIAEQNRKLEGKWHLFDLEPFEYDILDGSAKMPKNQTRLDIFS